MNNLKYSVVEEELVTSTVSAVAEDKHPRPYLVSRTGENQGELTRRVEAALDADFANGSMPA